MKPYSTQQKRTKVLDLVAIGSALLTAALFLYPIVDQQGSGLANAGAIGTKALLVTPGLLLLVAGLILSIRARKTGHK